MEMKKMNNKIKNIGIIGSGSWGTALAIYLSRIGYNVIIWGRDTVQIDFMKKLKKNPKYLKEFPLNEKIFPVNDISFLSEKCEIILNAIPTQHIRGFYSQYKNLFLNKIIISTSKGIEEKTLKLVDEIFFDIFQNNSQIAFLSGPTFAQEVASAKPTAVTICSYNRELAEFCQKIFNSNIFRVYLETDVKGVLLGGALKNVIAIAGGIIEGLNLGLNSLAALVTRGLAEIRRLGEKIGANSLTFSGLTGLGDLVLTCYGNLSRNRRVGIELGKGKKLNDILKKLGEVAEGVYTCNSAYEMSKKFNVEMPITTEVYKIIYEQKSPLHALQDLMQRNLKHEKD